MYPAAEKLTDVAVWLDETFASYDHAILSFLHTLAEGAGVVLTPVMRFFTLIGEKGLLMFLLAAVLLCFPKTRKAGVCVFGAVCCGALITNLILKDLICRPRPMFAQSDYYNFWVFLGSPAEDGFSFPSGHTTAAMAGMTAFCLSLRKKQYLFFALPYVFLIAVSRNYLMAHYPSDVLFSLLIGGISAGIAYAVTKAIWHFLEKYHSAAFCRLVLTLDIRTLFRKKKTS